MKNITVENFAKLYVEEHKEEKEKDVMTRLNDALNRKKSGVKCQCGEPIWAIGSAIGSLDACFTCITGKSDDVDEYEIY